jgi:hemerythrin-like domain-containing protein
MKLTEMLRIEHALIVQALDALRAVGEGIDDSPPPLEDITTLLDFFVEFTDGVHHDKEERLLFPTLGRFGLPSQGGPVGCMLSEHEEGRHLVGDLRRAADGGLGDQASRERFRSGVRDYAVLLGQHILKENEVLFEMAERIIPQDLLEEMGSPLVAEHRKAMASHGPRIGALLGKHAAGVTDVPTVAARRR